MHTLSNGPLRFREIERHWGGFPKIPSEELKESELNAFVECKAFATTPVTASYELTPYQPVAG